MRTLSFALLTSILVFACTPPSSKNSEEIETNNRPEQVLKLDGDAAKPLVVFLTGDEEYRSEEGMTQMAKILNQHHGMNCLVLYAQDPANPGMVDANYLHNIPGLDALDEADLMVIFTRFRALPDDQMQLIDTYLKKGKPVLGIRTATHAFRFTENDSTSFRHYGNYYNEEGPWQGGFGRLVLGEKWIRHHGNHGNQSTRGMKPAEAADHPIWNGIDEGSIWGPTDVYGVRLPLPGDALPIVLGQTVDRTEPRDDSDPLLGMRPTDDQLPDMVEANGEMINQNDPMMPVAWTKSYQLPEGDPGKSFTSTIGSSTDLLATGTRRLLVNAAFWLLDMEVPAQANVDVVGDYQPTAFGFKDDAYWDDRNIQIGALK